MTGIKEETDLINAIQLALKVMTLPDVLEAIAGGIAGAETAILGKDYWKLRKAARLIRIGVRDEVL